MGDHYSFTSSPRYSAFKEALYHFFVQANPMICCLSWHGMGCMVERQVADGVQWHKMHDIWKGGMAWNRCVHVQGRAVHSIVMSNSGVFV